jgi:murein DD-endopeptidase MepM/ murein hydrolase activator NlpD
MFSPVNLKVSSCIIHAFLIFSFLTFGSFINKKETDSLYLKTDSNHQVVFDISILGIYTNPYQGKVISPFGPRGKQIHTGTDIKLQLGDSVRASFTGIVTKSSKYYGYGLLVVINHGSGFETYYAHLSKCLVNDGDSVKSGDVIGLGGRTGRATTTHLHFEIRYNGKAYNASKLFNFQNACLISNVFYDEQLPPKENDSSEIYIRENEVAASVNIIPSNNENSNTKNETKVKLVEKNGAKGIGKIHNIKKGDTLYSLARKYGTTVEKLQEINKLSSRSKLKIGMKLKVE